MAAWHITAFYKFISLEKERLPSLRDEVKDAMLGSGIVGLVLLAEEGVNGTIGGSTEAIEEFKRKMEEWTGGPVRFKDSFADQQPFKRTIVDIRKEIVTLKRPDFVPPAEENSHLSPKEWHEMLASDEDKFVIDTRNIYETQIGKFKGAIDPGLKNFSEWGDYLRQSGFPKDKPVMIYCTGGIRCEKAILEMQDQGFEKVYQLRDGILGYLAEYPDGLYEGECFVFDRRVAVDQHLEPTQKYGICPSCGFTADIKAVCDECQSEYFICADCQSKWPNVCSKECYSYLRPKQIR